jgi:hypothetical protein
VADERTDYLPAQAPQSPLSAVRWQRGGLLQAAMRATTGRSRLPMVPAIRATINGGKTMSAAQSLTVIHSVGWPVLLWAVWMTRKRGGR